MRANYLILARAAVMFSAAAPQAKPRIAFDLVTEKGFPITGAQQWQKVLGELGVSDLRIHSASGGEEIAVENQGTEQAPSYKVTGILKSDNLLHLPGRKKFSTRDVGAIRKWMAELADQGVAGVTQAKSAFGLLPKQLEAVHDDLKTLVTASTAGQPAAEVVETIGRKLSAPLVFDRAAGLALAEVTVSDELSGVSSGTALAAVLRPAGLVLQPMRPSGGELQYRVGPPVEGHEAWPVGWKSDQPARVILPALYELINVEIKDADLPTVLESIKERLAVHFLFDYNALALHKIDLAKVTVTVPGKRLSYSQILQKALLQAKLKFELRLDEAGKPLFWISTIRPA